MTLVPAVWYKVLTALDRASRALKSTGFGCFPSPSKCAFPTNRRERGREENHANFSHSIIHIEKSVDFRQCPEIARSIFHAPQDVSRRWTRPFICVDSLRSVTNGIIPGAAVALYCTPPPFDIAAAFSVILRLASQFLSSCSLCLLHSPTRPRQLRTFSRNSLAVP